MQVFIALSTVFVLIMGVAFSASYRPSFAGLVVFLAFVPTMFAAVQRIVTAYNSYQSVLPNVAETYALFNMVPTVGDRPGAQAGTVSVLLEGHDSQERGAGTPVTPTSRKRASSPTSTP